MTQYSTYTAFDFPIAFPDKIIYWRDDDFSLFTKRCVYLLQSDQMQLQEFALVIDKENRACYLVTKFTGLCQQLLQNFYLIQHLMDITKALVFHLVNIQNEKKKVMIGNLLIYSQNLSGF